MVQIHSSKRSDRALLTRIWTREHGVHIPTMDAEMRPNGAEGCLLSHRKVASTLHPPYLVLEDDAIPTQAVRDTEHVFHTLQAIASGDFDLVYLGGLPSWGRVQTTRFQGVVQGPCLATFAMVVFPKAAQFLRSVSFRNVPIDVELVRASNLRVAFVHPPLFVMASTRSDIGKNNFNRSETFARLLSHASPWWRFAIVWQRELAIFLVLIAVLVAVRWKANGGTGGNG